MATSVGSGEVLKRSDSRRLSQRQKPLRSQYRIFTRLRGLLRKTKSTGSNTATLISSSTSAARPSMIFESRQAWGRGTLFRLWRRVASWSASSRKKSGAQHRGSGKRFECGVHGALTLVWCISGSRLPSLILVELGALISVASTMVPWRNDRPRSSR